MPPPQAASSQAPPTPFNSLYFSSYVVPSLGLRDKAKRQSFSSIPIAPHRHLQMGHTPHRGLRSSLPMVCYPVDVIVGLWVWCVSEHECKRMCVSQEARDG